MKHAAHSLPLSDHAMSTNPTVGQFVSALKKVGLPKGRQTQFLTFHANAHKRCATMSQMAAEVGYNGFHGMNLQYGKLAKAIGRAMGKRNATISLLVEFMRPGSVTNREWVLVMREEFAEALRIEGWI